MTGAGSNPPYEGSASRIAPTATGAADRGVNEGQAAPRRCAGCGGPTDERPPASLGCCRFCGRPTCSWACATLHESACLLRTDSSSEFTDDDDTFVRTAGRAPTPPARRPRPKFCASFQAAKANCDGDRCGKGEVAHEGCDHAESRADKGCIRKSVAPCPRAEQSTLFDQSWIGKKNLGKDAPQDCCTSSARLHDASATHPARWHDSRVIDKDPPAAGHLYSSEPEDAAAMKLARSRLRDNIEIRRLLRGFTKAEPQPASQRPAAKGGDARMGWAELVRRGRLPQGGSSSEGGFDGACAGVGCVLNAAVAPPTKRSSDDLRHMPKSGPSRGIPLKKNLSFPFKKIFLFPLKKSFFKVYIKHLPLP